MKATSLPDLSKPNKVKNNPGKSSGRTGLTNGRAGRTGQTDGPDGTDGRKNTLLQFYWYGDIQFCIPTGAEKYSFTALLGRRNISLQFYWDGSFLCGS